MGRKRISDRALRSLAEDRIGRLMSLAAIEAREGRMERSQRYNGLACRIAMRCKVNMPYSTTVCPQCFTSLLPGRTSRTRISIGKITIQCLQCGSYRRLPFLKEKKESIKCRQEQRKM